MRRPRAISLPPRLAFPRSTGYVHEGHFVDDDWAVAKAYLTGSFVVDVLGTFPLNVVMMIATPENPYTPPK